MHPSGHPGELAIFPSGIIPSRVLARATHRWRSAPSSVAGGRCVLAEPEAAREVNPDMAENPGHQGTPNARQQPEAQPVDPYAQRRPAPRFGVSHAEEDRLESDADRRSRPRAELRLEVSAIDDFLAEACAEGEYPPSEALRLGDGEECSRGSRRRSKEARRSDFAELDQHAGGAGEKDVA